MKKHVVFALLLPFLLMAACEPSRIKESRKMYREYIKSTLKDPNSLVFYEEKLIKEHKSSGEIEFRVDYGARNSYGAMARTDHDIYVNVKEDYLIVDKVFVGKSFGRYLPIPIKDWKSKDETLTIYRKLKAIQKSTDSLDAELDKMKD
jgi:hypothetical protein